MSEGFAHMNEEQEARYREKVERLGFDPDFDTSGIPMMMPIRGIPPLRDLFGGTEVPEADMDISPLTAEKVPELTDMMCRQAIINYAFGKKKLASETILAELGQRFSMFPVLAYVAPDITVTAANPLIINQNSAVTVFGKVTIRDGGYIIISVEANFYCEQMEKIAGGNSPATHDITIQGHDGSNGHDGSSGSQGTDGNGGSGAECDCCGGTVTRQAKPGGPGGEGMNGENGINGEHGGNGPTANITIQSLTGNVTLLNRGGAGGHGGAGGRGGRGGTGGKGGNGRTCGAFRPDGAEGGRGGNGGNGGASANGGNAGNGGRVTVTYSAANQQSALIANNDTSLGGRKGEAGVNGAGGTGGAGGDRGGRQGPNGLPGVSGADNGRDGSNGNTGSLIVNGQPV